MGLPVSIDSNLATSSIWDSNSSAIISSQSHLSCSERLDHESIANSAADTADSTFFVLGTEATIWLFNGDMSSNDSSSPTNSPPTKLRTSIINPPHRATCPCQGPTHPMSEWFQESGVIHREQFQER